MKFVITLLLSVLFSTSLLSQKNTIVGQWRENSPLADGILTFVFAQGGKGVLKFEKKTLNYRDESCQCQLSANVSFTWKMEGTDGIKITLGTATGEYKLAKPLPDPYAPVEICMMVCNQQLTAIKTDYSDRVIAGDVLFVSNKKVWITGTEFNRVE